MITADYKVIWGLIETNANTKPPTRSVLDWTKFLAGMEKIAG